LTFSFISTENIKCNGSLFNATFSTVRIHKYLSDVQVHSFKFGLKKDGASSIFSFNYDLQ